MSDYAQLQRVRVVAPDAASGLSRLIPLIGGIVLALFYMGYYLADPSLPGNNRAYPLGWWGWFDQSQYIESARALRAFDFSPARHWFPLGYSLLAAPFTGWLPMHPFFFVDLGALLIAYAAFLSFARRLDVAPSASAVVFVLVAMADPRLAKTWAEPWNTTVSAALIWMSFAVVAAQFAAAAVERDRWRLARLAGLGLLLGALPLVRPTDALIGAVCGCTVVGAEIWRKQARVRDAVALLVGGLIVVVPYALLYLRIYGLHETAYVVQSRTLGFAVSQLPWKTYVLLIEPHPWFPDGVGLLARCPWIVLALAGIVPVLAGLRGAARLAACMLAVSIVAYSILFFSYIDLLPSGLWRYENVHYFKWAFPALGLFALLLMRELLGKRRRLAAGSLVVTVLVLSVRIVAVPVSSGVAARMVQFPGLRVGWNESYFGQEVLQDSRGRLANVEGMRLLPDSEGLRAIALRRLFVGPLKWVRGSAPGPTADGISSRRWGERLTFGYPCWLPPYPCQKLPPHS